MKLALTLMVRDEADIIGATIEHHLNQGFDAILVTDNGSIDGTYEILQGFGDSIDLRQDPVQRKQQHSVVTGMARDAFSRFGADWVVNADADEFWVSQNSEHSLRDVFEKIPPDISTFTVPVIDMTGDPANEGTGLQRLVYRDLRPVGSMSRLGIHAHSTPNTVHVGHEDVVVSQGNHFVDLGSHGELPPGLGLEVLHFPWRSWTQFERKVRNAGLAYEGNPALTPSPNHHGMREYRRLQRGSLQTFYVLRHPDAGEIARGIANGELTKDTRIAERYISAVPDQDLPDSTVSAARRYGSMLLTYEREIEALRANVRELAIAETELAGVKTELARVKTEFAAANTHAQRISDELQAYRSRRSVSFIDSLSSHVRARRRRDSKTS
ncbi:glycosyltransferase family 2 protein [Leifsonia sp. YAF41]|uniref:glycosyltransferase family 2 protein n=1 Tax=Leifsonia sp. YAF41 TaxID=3233086 RepID=UPI003F9C2EFA